MYDKKGPYKLSDLAKKHWPNTTEEDLISMIEAKSLKAWFWYGKLPIIACKPENISRYILYNRPTIPYFPGFAYAFGEAIGVLRWKDETEIDRLYFVKVVDYLKETDYPQELKKEFINNFNFCPAKEVISNGETVWTTTTYTITRSDLVIPEEEVRRLDPKFLVNSQDSENSMTQNNKETLISSTDTALKEQCIYGRKICGWINIAHYLEISASAAKERIKSRRFKKSPVKQGGNCEGGVWAWSKALDEIKANPVGSKKRKKFKAE